MTVNYLDQSGHSVQKVQSSSIITGRMQLSEDLPDRKPDNSHKLFRQPKSSGRILASFLSGWRIFETQQERVKLTSHQFSSLLPCHKDSEENSIKSSYSWDINKLCESHPYYKCRKASSDKHDCDPEQCYLCMRSRSRPGLPVVWPGTRLNESTQGLSMIYSYQCNRGPSLFKWQEHHSWYLQCHHVGCWVNSWHLPCHLYRRANRYFQENLWDFLSFQDHLRQKLSELQFNDQFLQSVMLQHLLKMFVKPN